VSFGQFKNAKTVDNFLVITVAFPDLLVAKEKDGFCLGIICFFRFGHSILISVFLLLRFSASPLCCLSASLLLRRCRQQGELLEKPATNGSGVIIRGGCCSIEF
jgi:hypothetical protein